jgi:hypothetical protein
MEYIVVLKQDHYLNVKYNGHKEYKNLLLISVSTLFKPKFFANSNSDILVLLA